MLQPEERRAVAGTTRILQIILLALIAGQLIFLGVIFTQPAPDAQQPAAQTMVLLAVGFAVLQLVLAMVVPRIIGMQHRNAIVARRPLGKGQAAPSSDAGGLLGAMQVRRIIAAALLEGAGFFNLVVYLQQRSPLNLAAAIAMMLGIAVLVPLRPLVEQWLENEKRTIRELRELEG